MSFLAPLFLVASAAIAIPIFVHLIQRERKRVILFPSLMFVQKIPYQSVRRRRIRHWALLMMRCAALLLIVAAFARPFLKQGVIAAAAVGGTREIVILLDHSASMSGPARRDDAKLKIVAAQESASRFVELMRPGARATILPFSSKVETPENFTDNQVAFTTARYRKNPLVITGPGAGPAVTAAGVLNDLLRLTT